MDPLEQAVLLLKETFGKKTLEDLRAQAELEPTGIATEALRVLGRGRIIFVVCVVDPEVIALLHLLFDLSDLRQHPSESWREVDLLDWTLGVLAGPKFSGKILMAGQAAKAVALISAEPHSMLKLEEIFRRPN